MNADALDMDRIAALADAVWKPRTAMDSRLDELARYIYPDRAGFAVSLSPEDEGRREIWDGTPEDAAQTLGAALGGLLTNPATDWFSLELADGAEPDREAKTWLADVTRRMLSEFANPSSGFQNEVNAFYLDLPVFGWAVFATEYRDGEGLRFRAVSPAQCAVAENASGTIDTLVRRYPLNAAQMAEEFGEAVSAKVQTAHEQGNGDNFIVTHIVMPLEKLPPSLLRFAATEGGGEPRASGAEEAGMRRTRNLREGRVHPFVSIYYETDTRNLLHIGGYFEFPFQTPRWSKRSGEVYGRGPGHAALPDIRVLNTVAAAQLTAAEKQADPPLLVPDDGVLGKINTHAGGITYYTPGHGERITPLPVASSLEVMELIIGKRQEAIRRTFLNDRIQMAGGQRMTATEVAARERKQMLVLGPVLGRLQSEFLGPLVERVFSLLHRAGELPETPASIRGREKRARYVSPIARAQKQGEADSFAGALAFITPLVQAAPRILDNFDADIIARDTQDVFGYPQKYLRAEKEVQALRNAPGGAIRGESAAAGPEGADHEALGNEENGG